MNNPIPPKIPTDSNFSSCNTTNLESQNLILKSTIVEVINNINPINLSSKQGIFVVYNVNLNVDEYIIFNTLAPFITENSIIFISILSADAPFGLITNPLYNENGGFSVRIQNIGPSILTNEILKLSYMIIN